MRLRALSTVLGLIALTTVCTGAAAAPTATEKNSEPTIVTASGDDGSDNWGWE